MGEVTHKLSEIHALWDVREVVADVMWTLRRCLAAHPLVLLLLLVKVLHESWAVFLRVLVHHPSIHSWQQRGSA